MAGQGIIIDIGTGDGSFVYELAKQYPDRFIIGIDPAHKPLVPLSAKIYKKPAKGGIPNAMYVLSGVENLPDELAGLANQVFINFPWSGLLAGIVLVDDLVWQNIRKVCQAGAYVDIIFGYDRNAEKSKMENLGLPDLSLNYIELEMAQKLLAQGFEMIKAQELTDADLENFPSSWAKKLRFGQDRTYYYIRLICK